MPRRTPEAVGPPSTVAALLPPSLSSGLPPIGAVADRLERITVCTRPFRAAGPRVAAERVGGKLVVHNYGHGGSGWSLSWGSAQWVLRLLREEAMLVTPCSVAVVGCGAMGLTTALTLQRAGFAVRVYARDLPPEVRSSRATGLWSPDSRFALAAEAGVGLAAAWERMARYSWERYGAMAAEPGSPIAFHDRYLLSELPPDEAIASRQRKDPIGFAHYEERLADLYTSEDLEPGRHPFRTAWARRLRTPRFNITAYSERLLMEFRAGGGTIERRAFHTPAELAGLPEAAAMHCTGYGARALFGDTSLIPVRGQIGWLPAQAELDYSLQWNRLSVVPRGDGIAVQVGASSDATGWNDAGETADRGEAEAAVRSLAWLQAGVPA